MKAGRLVVIPIAPSLQKARASSGESTVQTWNSRTPPAASRSTKPSSITFRWPCMPTPSAPHCFTVEAIRSALGRQSPVASSCLKLVSQWARMAGRARLQAAIVSASKAMIVSSFGSPRQPVSSSTSGGTISGPVLSSMKNRLPGGTAASTSANVGSRSPSNRASFQRPASSVRSSASGVVATT